MSDKHLEGEELDLNDLITKYQAIYIPIDI